MHLQMVMYYWCLGMLFQNFGHIVNMSSLAGKVGTNKRTSYCASKFGIIGMMDALRVEVVTCTCTVNLEIFIVKIFS